MDLQPTRPYRILLIDDDEDEYILTRSLLSRIPDTPFDLDWCSSFGEAKKLIEKGNHDVYLVDYRLGAHNGLELLEFAHPEKRREPFILLTGVGDKDLAYRSLKLAASDYLVKGTFNEELLARTLYYAIERKRFEEQRMHHLVELSRSKDEFISIASHQLRTPATGVKQYIGMVLEGFFGEVPADQRKMLEKAYDSNERQLRIVSDLLKVAQVDAGKVRLRKSKVKLEELIQDVITEQHDAFLSRQQKVIFESGKTSAHVSVDEDLIRMVMENIIDNAGKYSNEETTVRIELRNFDDVACIDVTDEGVGIRTADKPRLFQKFSRLENSLSTKVGGTGLGLYWAKKIIDLHGGRIDYESTPGKGTTFTIYLPK